MWGGGGVFRFSFLTYARAVLLCVTACGDHQALQMVQETEEVNAEHETGTAFPEPFARHPAKVSGIFTTTPARRIPRPPPCATYAYGAPQLRRPGVGDAKPTVSPTRLHSLKKPGRRSWPN
ncbi:MAG: hypothetical protein IPM55_21745 [Acidobacteria bacterium]|nr:hypothetical protein [Acidobacteriota bacterium]